jgi:N4-gp56 family major capsid protein
MFFIEKENIKMTTYTLNLQHFADYLNALDSAGGGGYTANNIYAGLAAENQIHYDKTLIRAAQPNLIHAQFAQKRPIPKNGGKTINFRRFESLPKATAPLVEGITPEGNKLQVSEVTSEVEQYGDFVTVSDILDLTAIDPVVVEATQVIGNQAGMTLDTIVRDVLHTCTNEFFAPEEGGSTDAPTAPDWETTDYDHPLTVNLIKKVVAFLKKNNAPKIDGAFVGIIHPMAAVDIMNDDAWIDVNTYADSKKIFEGELGTIAGVRFVESSEAKVSKNSHGAKYFTTLILGENAYGDTEIEGGGLRVIVKQLGSAGTADPLDQRSTIGWKATKTAEVLLNTNIVKVHSYTKLGNESADVN